MHSGQSGVEIWQNYANWFERFKDVDSGTLHVFPLLGHLVCVCVCVCLQTVKRRTTDDKKSAGHCSRLTVSADMLNRVCYCYMYTVVQKYHPIVS